MIVTDIKAVTKQKYQIEIDGQPAFVLYKGELSRYQIETEKEISEEHYREITEELLVKRAKLRAMHLLEKSDRTKAELRRKLEQSGYSANAVDAAIRYVESFHYIDDVRYAAMYIESQKAKKGKVRLKMELLKKGIDADIIEDALEKADIQADSREIIREMLKKKRCSKGPMDQKEKQKLYGFFMRKGFSSSDILSVFRKNEE